MTSDQVKNLLILRAAELPIEDIADCVAITGLIDWLYNNGYTITKAVEQQG